MTLGRLHRTSIAAVPILGVLGVVSGSPVLLVAGILLGASTLFASVGFYDAQRSLLRRVAVHGTTIASLAFAIVTFPRNRIDAVLLVLMLGVFNRQMLRAGHRDDLLIVGASTVLIAAATTITPGVEFALLTFLAIPAILWGLWTSMILGAAPTPQAGAMRARRVPRKMMRLAAAGLALTVGGFAMVSVLPRFNFAPVFAAGAFAGLPGATDSMELRTGGVSARRDGTVVVRVEPLTDEAKEQLHGLYARLWVLDKFDGKRWGSSEQGHFRFAPPPAEAPAGSKVKVTISRVEHRAGHHPVPAIGRTEPFAMMNNQVHQDLSGSWVIDRLLTRTFWYEADLSAPPRDVALAEGWRRARARNSRHIPDTIDPRIVALAKRLTDGKPTDKAKVDAVLAHFAKGYEYSLDALDGDEDDPLTRFLFEAKTGHCEMYAGAVAVLLRAAGVPSRVATGYYGGHYNDMGGYWAFTQDDAHAWVEVQDGSGWRWVDATPEDMRAQQRNKLWAALTQLHEAASAVWYDYVVDYDNKAARNAFSAVAWRVADSTRSWKRLTDNLGALSSRATEGAGAGILVLLAVPVLLLVGGLGLRRRGGDVERIGRRLRRALGARGKDNVTLQTLAATAPAIVQSPAMTAIGLYEALRFGADPRPVPKAHVIDAVCTVERAMKASKRR